MKNNQLYEAYSGKSDSEWEADLINSITDPIYRDLRWPTMPAGGLQRRLVGTEGIASIRGALRFRSYVNKILDMNGAKYDGESILVDFGAGWGRMARVFMKDVQPHKIFGLEPYEFVWTARESNPYVNFIQIDPLPQSPLRERFASHLVCYSVFTHFNFQYFDSWIKEFHRILIPGGVAFLTTLGVSFLNGIESVKTSGQHLDSWLKSVSDRLEGRLSEVRDKVISGEYFFLPSDSVSQSHFAECFVTDLFFRQKYAELFDVVSYSSNGEFIQDIVVLRRR
jgi:hypothetical protein